MTQEGAFSSRLVVSIRRIRDDVNRVVLKKVNIPLVGEGGVNAAFPGRFKVERLGSLCNEVGM